MEDKYFNSFIEKGNKRFNNKFDYSKATYVNGGVPIKIICPEHGEFEQVPHDHLKGCGCPLCSMNKGERKLLTFIQEKFLNYEIIPQGSPDWLEQQRFDIYFPEFNIAIEYQGEQHFRPVDFFGGEAGFKKTKQYDARKRLLSKYYDCKLFYFTYDVSTIPRDYKYTVYTSERLLVDDINEYIESKISA